MEAASSGIQAMLLALSEETDVSLAVTKFTRQIEIDYAEKKDIVSFIFALRSIFCWHRIYELTSSAEKVKEVRDKWIQQNDAAYTKWLLSPNDNNNMITWAKWTFQAKNSILSESLKATSANVF